MTSPVARTSMIAAPTSIGGERKSCRYLKEIGFMMRCSCFDNAPEPEAGAPPGL
jgi:hypothetical protein